MSLFLKSATTSLRNDVMMKRLFLSQHRYNFFSTGKKFINTDLNKKTLMPPQHQTRDYSWGTLDQAKRRIKVITMDVTGTMVSFSGKLEDHYANAARYCGVDISDEVASKLALSFHDAYRETSTKYPCFGNSKLSAKDWWRACVLRSFEIAGVTEWDDHTEQSERVFQRVYSIFGSHATYSAFPDAQPFLRWAHRHNIVCGVVSNADERYGDSILPMLGLAEGLDFFTFSKEVGAQKPDPKIFDAALRAAEEWLPKNNDVLHPCEILHIGNDYEKDYLGATQEGCNAVLLNRYNNHALQNTLVEEWEENGAPVLSDLLDVVDYLARNGFYLGYNKKA